MRSGAATLSLFDLRRICHEAPSIRLSASSERIAPGFQQLFSVLKRSRCLLSSWDLLPESHDLIQQALKGFRLSEREIGLQLTEELI